MEQDGQWLIAVCISATRMHVIGSLDRTSHTLVSLAVSQHARTNTPNSGRSYQMRVPRFVRDAQCGAVVLVGAGVAYVLPPVTSSVVADVVCGRAPNAALLGAPTYLAADTVSRTMCSDMFAFGSMYYHRSNLWHPMPAAGEELLVLAQAVTACDKTCALPIARECVRMPRGLATELVAAMQAAEKELEVTGDADRGSPCCSTQLEADLESMVASLVDL